MDKRNYEAEALARELNFATSEDLRDNFLERKDFIKLLKPIGNIKMIFRSSKQPQTFEEAQICAQNCRIADFKNWQLPTLEELELIYKLHEAFPELFPFTSTFWSYEEENNEVWVVNFLLCGSAELQNKSTPNDVILVHGDEQNE